MPKTTAQTEEGIVFLPDGTEVNVYTLKEMLHEAAALLEGCRGYFAYQTAQGDKFAPDAAWERPIIEWLERYKESPNA